MGCSTNAIIHLIAQARRAGQDIGLDDFEKASRKVPVIANVRPSGDKYLMEDFFYAGGLPGLMSRIKEHLHLGCDDRHRQDARREHRAAPRSTMTTSSARVAESDLRRRRARGAEGQSRARRLRDQAQRLRAALPEAHRPGAGVRRLSVDEEGDRRSRSRRHRRSRADPAQCRARRAGPACRNGACCRSRQSW